MWGILGFVFASSLWDQEHCLGLGFPLPTLGFFGKKNSSPWKTLEVVPYPNSRKTMDFSCLTLPLLLSTIPLCSSIALGSFPFSLQGFN